MKYKVICAAFFTLLLALGFQTHAQEQIVPRIGYLSRVSAEQDIHLLGAFREGLEELGYVEGKHIVIEQRYSEGRRDLLYDLAGELVRLNVAIIVTGGGGVRAAKKATMTIPIVMTFHANPVEVGLVDSLARPGGNVTGLSDFHAGVVTKRLEVLKEAVPSIARVAVLSAANVTHEPQLKDLQSVAPALGLTLLPVTVTGPNDFNRAFAKIKNARPQGLLMLGAQMFRGHQKRIIEFAAKYQLPAIYTRGAWADAGGLMSYGTHWPSLFRRAATYVDKILKGRKPSKLPVERPTKFEFVVNLKAAKQIGVTIPQSVLYRADRVIR